MKPFVFIALFPLVICASAHANSFIYDGNLPKDSNTELKIGIGANYQAPSYRADKVISAVPLAFYDNNIWYVEGAEAGFYPIKTDMHEVRLGLTYDGQSFDPSDAVNDLRRLDERKSSVLAHANYMYISKFGGLRAKISTDILGKHKGTMASVSHISRFTINDATLYPSFGVTWQDKKYNNYYYGVSQAESGRLGISSYTADSGILPFVSLTVDYTINDNFGLFGNQRLEWLASTQKDSPLIDGKTNSSTTIGLMYRFK